MRRSNYEQVRIGSNHEVVMNLLNDDAKHSLQTFIYAAVFFALAIFLTFVEDWCEMTKRPQ